MMKVRMCESFIRRDGVWRGKETRHTLNQRRRLYDVRFAESVWRPVPSICRLVRVSITGPKLLGLLLRSTVRRNLVRLLTCGLSVPGNVDSNEGVI
jgi:hypothetical protein